MTTIDLEFHCARQGAVGRNIDVVAVVVDDDDEDEGVDVVAAAVQVVEGEVAAVDQAVVVDRWIKPLLQLQVVVVQVVVAIVVVAAAGIVLADFPNVVGVVAAVHAAIAADVVAADVVAADVVAAVVEAYYVAMPAHKAPPISSPPSTAHVSLRSGLRHAIQRSLRCAL